MTEAKDSTTGVSKVEMVEAAPNSDASDAPPPNELKQELHPELEERTTAKAWCSIFVSLSS